MISKRPKLTFFKKKVYSPVFETEQVEKIMQEFLLGWIDSVIHLDCPFHLKFYLSFLTVNMNLMESCSSQIYFKVFQNMTSEFVLSIIKDKSNLEMFLKYQSDISKSPQLLYSAMQEVSRIDIDNFILFLPLYHVLFNSKHSFNEAHTAHDFLNMSYWGLPPDILFTHNHTIELPIIVNTLSQYNSLGPILPYSITLLCLKLEIFSQLMEILAIPFLPFIAVLLYRIDRWNLMEQDRELRERVYETFLAQSELNPNLLNDSHICQASDVIYKMLQLINDSQSLSKKIIITYNEADLLLQVLAKLLLLYHGHENLLASQKIFNLIPSSDLLDSITRCVDDDKMNQKPECGTDCLHEVLIWNTFLCIQFPSSYRWVQSVSKTFSIRLESHTLACLLNLFLNICSMKDISPLPSLFQTFRQELIRIVEKSQRRLLDEHSIFQNLVKVTADMFTEVIDVFAFIILLHESAITGADPVEHILSLSWLPILLKHCESKMLKSSNYPKSSDLFNKCIEVLRVLTTEFYLLTIQVNHMSIVLQSNSIYFSILQNLPEIIPVTANELSQEDFFNQAVTFRANMSNYFLRQHKFIAVFKKLLDSTNSGVYSKEINNFLAIDFSKKPISDLCRSVSGDQEFILNPDNPSLNVFNNRLIRIMLSTLPDFLKSQFFKVQFEHFLNIYLEETNNIKEIDLNTIHSILFFPTFTIVSDTISDLFDLTILLTTIDKHFSCYADGPELMNTFTHEIKHIVTAVERVTGKSYKLSLNETMGKVSCYFTLHRAENIAISILKVRKAYHFTEKFTNTEFVSNLKELNVDNTQLSQITPELRETTEILNNLTPVHKQILQTLLNCVDLFTWTAGIVEKSSELDNFIDLALNSVESTSTQVNRITCYKSVCTIFMPFIFDLQNVDEMYFLKKLSIVHENIESRDDTVAHLLKMSSDCARESELEFWKELQLSHKLMGGKTISKLKQIMQCGKFVLTTNTNTHTVDDILKLYIRGNELSTTDNHSPWYNFNALREMQSDIILITPLMHEDKDSVKFVAQFEEIVTLTNLILKLNCSGNIFFMNLFLEYTCNSIDVIKNDISYLTELYLKWSTQFLQARKDNYLLNHFTDSQILKIQIGLDGLNRQKDLDRDTIHLLTLIREELSHKDIIVALDKIKRGACTYTSPTHNNDSFQFPAEDVNYTSSIVYVPMSCQWILLNLKKNKFKHFPFEIFMRVEIRIFYH
ncbi:E3 ubiquitin-protein ligase [Oopsacas minuta]|uniref:E3 ubiquitin-protein ligase n=1 Tax=Oopsacas minuta TaxID=111878 RepID=A0AAV7JS00_9METZ|nr:E3 ubiquitin-protein ligase [Oopsacas minuta]